MTSSMDVNTLIKAYKIHVSSISLVVLYFIQYTFQPFKWLSSLLPQDILIPFLGLLVMIVLLYEFVLRIRTDMTEGFSQMASQVKIGNIVRDISYIHQRFLASGDEFIVERYNIKEVMDLKDGLLAQGVDIEVRSEEGLSYSSYEELTFLCSKIKR